MTTEMKSPSTHAEWAHSETVAEEQVRERYVGDSVLWVDVSSPLT